MRLLAEAAQPLASPVVFVSPAPRIDSPCDNGGGGDSGDSGGDGGDGTKEQDRCTVIVACRSFPSLLNALVCSLRSVGGERRLNNSLALSSCKDL